MVFLTAYFLGVFPEKRLELKSLKGQTKAKELGDRVPELLSLRLSHSGKMAEPRLHRGGTDPLLKDRLF
jgi:hypothetical protein